MAIKGRVFPQLKQKWLSPDQDPRFCAPRVPIISGAVNYDGFSIVEPAVYALDSAIVDADGTITWNFPPIVGGGHTFTIFMVINLIPKAADKLWLINISTNSGDFRNYLFDPNQQLYRWPSLSFTNSRGYSGGSPDWSPFFLLEMACKRYYGDGPWVLPV